MTNSQRREQNIRRTVEAALQCFQELGIEATTQLILAQKVGLTTKTIQRYFKSKEEIILLAMKRLNEQYYNLMGLRLKTIDMDSLPGLEECIAFLEAHEIFFEKENRILLLMLEMHMYLIRRNHREYDIIRKVSVAPSQQSYLYSSLKKGMEDGSIRKDLDLHLAYATLTSAFTGMMQMIMLMPEHYENGFEDITKEKVLKLYIERVRADLQPPDCQKSS